MPIFNFKCLNCGRVYEGMVGVTDNEPYCLNCGSKEKEKLFTPTASCLRIFKGSTFNLEKTKTSELDEYEKI